MRYLVLLCIGCGSVKANDKHDASPGDTGSCSDHASPMSCGPTCAVCQGAGGRQVATCDGTSCGLACADTAPRCSDNSCSKVSWTFEDGTLDGITPRQPNNLAIAVRSHLGSMALAMDVVNLTEVSFTMPICVTGNANFASKTLTAKVFYEGGTSTGQQFYVQASVPQPTTGDFLAQQGVAANVTETFTAAMSASAMSNATTTVVFQAGTLGQPFSGTIWFDDIAIQ